MKDENQRKAVDFYINLLIAYFFILSIIITFLNFQVNFENYIMLTILMIIALISYYFNVTISLVITLIIDFIYGTYNLYKNISTGISLNNEVYLWIVFMPLTAVIVSLVSRNILLLQNKVEELEDLNEELVMINPLTGDRNIKAFTNEIPIYISMNKRYNIPITIMIVKFKYGDRLKTIVGKDYFNNILIKSSGVLSESLRVEDRKYILNDSTFVYILISDNSGSKVVENRLKENIKNIEMKDRKFNKNINLEIQVGSYTYEGDVKDPLELLKKAEKELEYDV
ncbi:diguanylate cyclase [Clostridium sp. C8]|uniref:diguanylate cyclase domain-containing protein n=1 Tax=Clostridium sp. C8 TaxID=1667357 RepID=UPI00062E4C15|nr:diguanylate cyclase [Clostridium sp. C8]KLE16659.1 diguanylate cyclase [Clostridium sp. C8]